MLLKILIHQHTSNNNVVLLRFVSSSNDRCWIALTLNAVERTQWSQNAIFFLFWCFEVKTVFWFLLLFNRNIMWNAAQAWIFDEIKNYNLGKRRKTHFLRYVGTYAHHCVRVFIITFYSLRFAMMRFNGTYFYEQEKCDSKFKK